MTAEVAGLIAWLALFGAGAAVLRLATRREGWGLRGRLEFLVTASMIGAALVPALVYAAIWLAGPLPVWLGQALVYALAALGAFGLVAVAQRRGFTPNPACFAWQRTTPFDRVLVGLCVVFAALAAVLSVAWPVHLFDPVFHFAYKGKVLWHEGLGTGAFTTVEGLVGRVMTHPSYPPGVPALEVLASYPLGEFTAHAGRLFSALFVIAPAVWIASALEDRSRRAQLVGALLWLSLPVIYYYRLPHNDVGTALSGLVFGPELTRDWFGAAGLRRTDGATLDGGGDLPVAAFLCGVVVYLGRAWKRRGDGVIAGLLLAGAILAKNEGLAMAAVLGIAFALTMGARRVFAQEARPRAGLAAFATALGLALALCLPYLVFKGQIPVIDESYPELMKPGPLTKALTEQRFYQGSMEPAPVTVGREYLLTFTDVLRWNLLWPLFVAALGCALVRPGRAVRHGALLPALTTAGALSVFFLILVVTPWHLGSLFRTGIPDRLFLQVAPLAAWAIAAWVFAPEEDAA